MQKDDDNKRPQLLTRAEIDALYARPVFNRAEQRGYFYLESADRTFLQTCKTLKAKMFYILQMGYFRAKQQFYTFMLTEVEGDVQFIADTLLHLKTRPSGALSRERLQKQRHFILEHYGYRHWKAPYCGKTQQQLAYLVKLHPKGHDTLKALLAFLESEKIMIPSYRTLQDLVTQALSCERERLATIINSIASKHKTALVAIIKNEDDENLLNVLRQDQKDFRYYAIRAEVEKSTILADLYHLVKALLPTLDLANNTIRYYADLVHHYAPARTRKLTLSLQHLYVLCFIYHRYQIVMDNLIMSFQVQFKQLKDEGISVAKQAEITYLASLTLEFPKLAKLLEWLSSDNIAPDVTYQQFCKEAFSILPKEKQLELARYISGIKFNIEAAKWAHYEKCSRKIAMYLRPIMTQVSFGHIETQHSLLTCLKTLRDHYCKNRPSGKLMKAVPEALLNTFSQKEKENLGSTADKGTLHPARFEMLVYTKLYQALEKGVAFCNDSVSFADLEVDLVKDALVDKADEVSENLGFGKLSTYCTVRLSSLTKEVETLWLDVNRHIKEGTNQYFTLKSKDTDKLKWTLGYPKVETNHTDNFFDALPQTDIMVVLKLIADKVKLWSTFKPFKDRYTKQREADPVLLLGCILAEALGFGSNLMSNMSNVSVHQLRTIDENFMYVDNLRAANDEASNFIYQQAVSRVWDLLDNQILADTDGQKYETKFQTIQSRFSAKYFGTYKGISISTLVANHIPVNSKVIGPNEHESHHLYDIIYNNSSDVKIGAMTGDGHSKNQCNYISLDPINVAFMPSISKFCEEVEKLVGTKPLKSYTGILKPGECSELKVIQSQERGIQRILLSLMLQKTTQSVIIRKLSSHKRYSKLKDAFWAYNKLFHTRHVLTCVDDVNVRQAIKTARNRTEAYHQLHRTIRKVYGGVFKGKRIVDNAISAQASRLVCNLMIAYNVMLLEKIYQRLVKRVGEEKARKIIKHISPVAWQHILLTGRYDLLHLQNDVNIEKLVDILEKMVVTN